MSLQQYLSKIVRIRPNVPGIDILPQFRYAGRVKLVTDDFLTLEPYLTYLNDDLNSEPEKLRRLLEAAEKDLAKLSNRANINQIRREITLNKNVIATIEELV
ncbi:hypothetical protein J4449_01760 [Candidatus Woesearchaeota archaeon]|nr:hypothetical protein [Candidatus Woesearchaeota archaeon]